MKKISHANVYATHIYASEEFDDEMSLMIHSLSHRNRQNRNKTHLYEDFPVKRKKTSKRIKKEVYPF